MKTAQTTTYALSADAASRTAVAAPRADSVPVVMPESVIAAQPAAAYDLVAFNREYLAGLARIAAIRQRHAAVRRTNAAFEIGIVASMVVTAVACAASLLTMVVH